MAKGKTVTYLLLVAGHALRYWSSLKNAIKKHNLGLESTLKLVWNLGALKK